MTTKNNVLVYNKKGGQGKTTIAVNLAKATASQLFTNDVDNFTEAEFNIETYTIGQNDNIEDIEIKDDQKSNVFDFGGFADSRVEILAGYCNVCVVPICYQSSIDLRCAKESMTTVQEHNDNCIFVINNTDKRHIEELKQHLEKTAPTFIIPKTTFLEDNENSVYELLNKLDDGIKKYTLQKRVIPYFDELFKKINEVINE